MSLLPSGDNAEARFHFKGNPMSTIRAYVGTKIIKAAPQEKDGEPGYQVFYPDGYISWSPKATFENAYRPVSEQERQLVLQS